MRILTVNNYQELSSQTEALFLNMLNKKNRPLRGFLPAGQSAQGFYNLLIQKKDLWSEKIQFLQIDEFTEHDGFFLNTLKSQILEPLSLLPSAEIINPYWSEEEFMQHIIKVLRFPIDFALLGLGPNGHVGFHEPGPRGSDYLGGITQLSSESYQRVKEAPSQTALSFGAGSFLQAEEIILLVTGEGKENIFKKILSTTPTSLLPASLLKTHPNFTVITTISPGPN